MSSSRPQSPKRHSLTSPANFDVSFAANQLDLGLLPEAAGSMNDSAMVRSVIVDAMRKCPKSRAVIADQMSHLTGTTVTERMLNAFAADSREDHRFPSELERAFCAVVGDDRLLTCRAEAAGLHVIDQAGLNLLEIGRKYLTRKRSDAALLDLERRLEGVEI